MNKSLCRKFTIVDAMILVASTAPAFTAWRSRWPLGVSRQWIYAESRKSLNELLLLVNLDIYCLSIFIACLTVACLVLWLRQPRPSLRELARRPGMVACTAAVIVLAIRLINFGCVIGIRTVDGIYPVRGLSMMDFNVIEFRGLPSEMGCAVAASWVIQRISERWHCEPSWLDRTGRILGVFWVGTIPFSWFTTSWN